MNELVKLLKESNLSDNAISIYSECLGRSVLTFNEIYSLIPQLSSEDFTKIIKELLDSNLLARIEPQKPEIPLYYSAVPPLISISNYYTNIEAKISSINEVIAKSINQIIKENNKIEGYNNFQEIKNEYIEEIGIQKQSFEEIIAKFEKIKKIKNIFFALNNSLLDITKVLTGFSQRFKGVIQTQFGNLIRIISAIKTKILLRIKSLDSKKYDEEILNVIEDVFKAEFEQMVQEFLETINTLIEIEFKNTNKSITGIIEDTINGLILKPIKNIIENAIHFETDFKMLYQNLMGNFDDNMNKIQQSILANKENMEKNMEEMQNSVVENLNRIIQDLISQVSDLWKPLEKIMKHSLDKIISSEDIQIDNIWFINSRIKIIDEITHLITNSKEEVILIIPQIEDFLNKEQFQNLPESLKIKIVSSNSHKDNIVKELMKIKNIEFRILKNENTIALKGDQNHIVYSLVKNDSQDPLNDSIGLGSNFRPLIEIFIPTIETTWSVANAPPKPEPESISKVESVIEDLDTFESKIEPKSNDGIGNLINIAFNKLIAKLNMHQGYEFSSELQKVSDIIFEKIGFCSTLHSISSLISLYKRKYADLDDNDKMQIITSIENWKQEIFLKTGRNL